MISAKEAVEFAKKYLHELNANQQLKDFALEGVSFNDGKTNINKSTPSWNITLGFHQKRDISSFGTGGFGGSSAPVKLVENRVYKNVEINAMNGEFLHLGSHFSELA